MRETLYGGRGDNTFNEPVFTPLTEHTSAVVSADLNGDGLPDLAGTGDNTVWVRMGTGNGGFGPTTFTHTTPSLPNGPPFIGFGDFTRDGKQDLVVASGDGSLAVFPGKGDGTFDAPLMSVIPGYPSLNQATSVITDINSDGALDLILPTYTASTSGLVLLLGNGDGTFRTQFTNISGAPAFSLVAAADFNRDGAVDLIVNAPYRGSPRQHTLYQGYGDASFGPALLGPPPSTLLVADVDGDGFPDLVESDGNGFAVFLNLSPAPAALSIVSGATFTPGLLAPGSFASAFGFHLAGSSLSLAGTSVSVQDAAGVTRTASLTHVSPGQINFIVPPETAVGAATVTVKSSSLPMAGLSTQIVLLPLAPALFTVPGYYVPPLSNSLNAAAAYGIRVDPGGQQSVLPIFGNSSLLNPIDLSQPGEVYLALYGTGFDTAKVPFVTASIEGVPAQVTYAGPAPQLPGVDQVNLRLPPSLAGKGVVFVSLAVGGVPANSVVIPVR